MVIVRTNFVPHDFIFTNKQKVETKLIGSRHTNSEKKSTVDKERVKAADGKDVSFWLLLEGALGDVLSPTETATFIGKMKKVSHLPTLPFCMFDA